MSSASQSQMIMLQIGSIRNVLFTYSFFNHIGNQLISESNVRRGLLHQHDKEQVIHMCIFTPPLYYYITYNPVRETASANIRPNPCY